MTPKPTLLAGLQRLNSQVAGIDESSLLDQLSADSLATTTDVPTSADTVLAQPCINEGDEFQALIPDLIEDERGRDALVEREDLMWSNGALRKLGEEQLRDYLDLVGRGGNAMIHGSSSNLELGLHVLQWCAGDVRRALRAFLENALEVSEGHPLTTYKYAETEVWSTKEIKTFEAAIFKHDKNFAEISREVCNSLFFKAKSFSKHCDIFF